MSTHERIRIGIDGLDPSLAQIMQQMIAEVANEEQIEVDTEIVEPGCATGCYDLILITQMAEWDYDPTMISNISGTLQDSLVRINERSHPQTARALAMMELGNIIRRLSRDSVRRSFRSENLIRIGEFITQELRGMTKQGLDKRKLLELVHYITKSLRKIEIAADQLVMISIITDTGSINYELDNTYASASDTQLQAPLEMILVNTLYAELTGNAFVRLEVNVATDDPWVDAIEDLSQAAD